MAKVIDIDGHTPGDVQWSTLVGDEVSSRLKQGSVSERVRGAEAKLNEGQ